ncbi:type 1 glutamine amidotransferase domain-containing protein [Rhodococcus jostii]|uniref:Putative intracellular protease/amidase n=1 Tax=Rhodococcus jostii TaxID=132919 RepID=A0A1H4IWH5_RHOJO|nr:type 1 glutamine amidotransferase domain-containing protein [Rhodococcus jostii]SEB37648.1 Putative intracellular protease/amidase [Rhodococcus jostii]
MSRILFAVTGSDSWTLADGTVHPCGYWPEELAVPHEVFADADAGFEITIATPGGVRPVADEAGFSPEMNGGTTEPGERFRSYLDGIAEILSVPTDLNGVRAEDFDLVFVPGGHGPMEDLAVSDTFGALIGEFVAQSKLVAAVCHGPAALLPARNGDGSWLFTGRRVTGFSNAEESQVGFADKAPWLLQNRLTESGGVFEESGSPWQEHVTVDGNLYTGQNPASSRPLAEALVAALVSARV